MVGQSRIRSTEASPFDQNVTAASFNTSTPAGFEAWIYWNYRRKAFDRDGTFKGLSWLRKYLFSLGTGHTNSQIKKAWEPLWDPNHKYSLAHTNEISRYIREGRIRHNEITNLHDLHREPSLEGISLESTVLDSKSGSATSPPHTAPPSASTIHPIPANNPVDLLSWMMGRKSLTEQQHERNISYSDIDDNSVEDDSDPDEDDSISSNIDFDDMDSLLSSNSGSENEDEVPSHHKNACIADAPLIDVEILSSDSAHLLPQYGLLGWHKEARNTKSKLFLNTNEPFSMFVCGVQGSGKSHTTSCILENALVANKRLGKLQTPLSALVFNYSQFSGDGIGFTVSEVAYLASPSPGLAGAAHVREVHVLVSPSNYVRIARLYRRLPNVLISPFKLNPRDLDIDTMLTLMNVNESDETPLYMAQVTQILRNMSTAGGPFDYLAFKRHLRKKDFNQTQSAMLQMRLDLLESFLDMDMNGTSSSTVFRPGEITIMDMSCPFVEPNTACTLFNIGLKQYLQSEGKGKMVVLDEAHKYIRNVPGAKSLNETLAQTIRLQRHYGVRVVISTQEPTLLTDLIALCAVTVIHRFSSPEWLAAIRRHIPITAEEREMLMRSIESLGTGKAIVYAPKAVLGRDKSGNLIMGTGKMINVSVRKRITSDGGQSVLAV